MNKELLAATLKNLDELMREELGTETPSRYMNVMRLCTYADKIRKMSVKRVGELGRQNNNLGGGMFAGANLLNFGGGGEDDEVPEFIDDEGGMQMPRLMGGHNQPADMVDLLRESIVATQAPKRKIQTVGDRANAVLDLIDLRAKLLALGRDVAVIDAKIDEATTQLKETKDADDTEVVHSNLSRGHQARGDIRALVHRDRGEGDGSGEGRARQALGEGDQEELALHGPAVPLLGEQAQDGDGRADREGGQGDRQGAEARPPDRVGGPVRRRQNGGDQRRGD